MNDDELVHELRHLGDDVTRTPPPADELRRVHRGIARRRRLRLAGGATAALAAVGVVAVVALPGTSHTARLQPTRPSVTAVPSTPPTAPPTLPSTASTPSARPPATTDRADVFAYVERRGGGGAGPARAGDGDLQLRDGRTGSVIRTLWTPTPNASMGKAVVDAAGTSVWAVEALASGTTQETYPVRIPVGGGAPQVVGPPTAGLAVLPSPDDTRYATVTATGTSTEIRDTATGRTLTTVTGTVIGWAPDGAAVYTGASTPAAGLPAATASTYTVARVALTAPTNPLTVYTTTTSSPGDDGACGGAHAAAAVLPTGTLVVATDGCSPETAGENHVRTVAPSSGAVILTVSLDPSWSGATAEALTTTPAGTIILGLTHQDCYTSAPIALIHGTQVVRPAVDAELCGTGR